MANNLKELLDTSSSTRRYFTSLPVWLQVRLHRENEFIHTAAQLRYIAGIWINQRSD